MWDRIRGIIKDNKTTDCDVNLLLFGETGVGKSTLINSISNYFNYPNFKKAQKGKIDVLIPMCISMSEGGKVHGTPNDNEMHNNGESSTQQVKVYLFPIKMDGKTFNLRLIDTPGVGDTRGLERDNVNLDNILAYLATLQQLHAICFVLKSNQTRFTKFFVYCLKQILTRLDKSASENIIFITTYSKTARYTAGETKHHCLIPLIKDIQSRPPHVTIPLTNDNIFALDNEAMTALLEIKEGKTFSKYDMEGLELLKYIIGDFKKGALKPHDVENTISINEVRFLIEQLSTPIAEVSELIQDNIRLLDRHKKRFNLETQTVDQLKTQLYIPCVDLEVKELDEPVTVCTDTKCADVVKVNNVTQWHYKQRCHNPCYLSGIPKEMIGDPGLIDCGAMSHGKCIFCGCPWQVHMHIYKETKKVDVHKEDQSVKNAIKNKEEVRVYIEQLMKDLNKRRSELEEEGQTISRIIAKFSYFLQEHALTPFNDAYSDYLKQLIKNEKHLGKFADQDVIDKLETLLSQHLVLQKTFQESAKNFQKDGTSDLTPAGIKKSITELYSLKHMGRIIQQLIQKSSSCRHRETQKNFSCVVSPAIDLDQKTAEEQYQYYKSPESEYNPDNYYDPDYTVTYMSRASDSEENRSPNYRDSSSRQPFMYRDEDRQFPNSRNFRNDHGSPSRHHSKRSPERRDRNETRGKHSSRHHHQEKREKSSRDEKPTRKNRSSRRSRSPEASHRRHHKVSPRRRQHSSDSYDSDDPSNRSSSRRRYSDDDRPARSSSRVKRSKTQKRRISHKHHNSDDERPKKSNRAKKNSSPQSTDSEESYDSSTDKKSSRKGKHSKQEDNSDSDDSTKKGVNRSKNQKERKSTKSSKTDSNASKSEQETRARNDKSSRSGRKKHAGRKSSPVDEHPTKSSRKERSTKEKGSKSQKKAKSEDESCDSDDKRSVRFSSDHEARNGTSSDETSFKEDEIHKHHRSDDERPKKSKRAKKNSSSQSTDSEESYDSSTEKKSSRRHRRRSQSDDSDDRNSVKSSRKGKHEDNSDSDDSTKNSGNRSKNQKEPKSTKSSKTDSNVSKSRKERSTKEKSSKNQKKPKSENESCDSDAKRSVRFSSDHEAKNGASSDETSFKEDEIHKHHKSDDERPKKSNRAKKNSSSQSTDSEESYDSSTEKKSSRRHRRRSQSDDSDDRNSVKSSRKGKHEDNSDSDDSTKNSGNRSKNQKEPKSTKSSKTDSNVSKSRKERNTKEKSSKNQKKPKSEDESCDSDDKRSVRFSSELETKNISSADETSFEAVENEE
ncbi:hypothetical protein Zmor_015081 [Zophobas morio]|uniref:G domain-containing protein n=1 Tax=Zophobas morio TaxID=2755281 RepID=A0AA38MHK0_9CUCU|nr:hypothetical protein Zmor_015081 [Zophobas morio]